VKTPDDIETLARLPALAVVPAFPEATEAGNKWADCWQSGSSNGHEKRIELVCAAPAKIADVGSLFRALRPRYLLSRRPIRRKVIW